MKPSCKVLVALGLLAMASGCATAPSRATAGAPPAPRFSAAADLVLADTGEAKRTGRYPPMPRYPEELRATNQEAAFASIFVVDTAGRVEYRTVSFAPDAPRPFLTAVCRFLREMHVAPIVGDGCPRRALVVRPWTFGLDDGVWFNRQFDEAPLRRAIAADGVAAAVEQLEARPHCD